MNEAYGGLSACLWPYMLWAWFLVPCLTMPLVVVRVRACMHVREGGEGSWLGFKVQHLYLLFETCSLA